MKDKPPFGVAGVALAAFIVVVALCGCASESREKQHMVISGTLNGEPVRLEIQGDSATITKSGLDEAQVAALAKAAASAVASEVISKIPGTEAIAAIAKATIGPMPAPKEPSLTEDLVKTGLGAAAAWAAAKTLESRYHAKDAAEGWSKALPSVGGAT